MRIIILFLVLKLLNLCPRCEGCMEEERETLLLIKNSINSPEGTAFPSWYGEDCCHWEGVECDVSTFQVIKLFFQFRRRAQEEWYPNATLFSQFKDLQELYLPGNRISGFLSSTAMHKLKHLQKLDLHSNRIASSSSLCWGNMPSLFYLDLSRNELQGDIPKCLCKSKSFTELHLSGNKLAGNIDACLSNMTSLKHLFVSDNLFNGTFPSLLFHNLTNILSFVISHNDFKDTISLSIFANLSKLSHLDISFNPDLEIETESPTWSPSFSLKQLKLGGCNLNKRSGRNIPNFLSTQYHLESLDLSYNLLVGFFPSWLLYNLSSELLVQGNNLSGPFPRSQTNTSSHLVTLDISDNLLYGELPADINLVFPELCRFNASKNMFTSAIPQSFAKMRQLQYLDLSSNILQGEIPRGIFSNMTQLQLLKFSKNNLEGEVLMMNFSLPNLRFLYLDRNGFAGPFSDSLSKCSSLQGLSIDHNDFLGDISASFPVIPELRVLILRGNRFKGSIPLQLCQLNHLHILDLSKNNFSGEIPTCLNNITAMKEEYSYTPPDLELHSWVSFDLSMKGHVYTYRRVLPFVDLSLNKLTGTLPTQMTELRMIQSLNMSNNLFTGQIPPSFGNLQELESLDLSCNSFSGSLPTNLTKLIYLSYFNVSFNYLSGPIPSGTLLSFSDDSYLGNPNLCERKQKKCHQPIENSGFKSNAKTITANMGMAILILSCCTIFFFAY